MPTELSFRSSSLSTICGWCVSAWNSWWIKGGKGARHPQTKDCERDKAVGRELRALKQKIVSGTRRIAQP